MYPRRTELGLLLAVAAVVAATAVLDDSYRAKPLYNAAEVARQTAVLGIFALGAGVVILAGGIDLSSGSVIAFAGVVCGGIFAALAPRTAGGMPDLSHLGGWVIAAGVGGTLLAGALVGTLHAWLIVAVRLPPFVATLASLVGLRSLGRVLVPKITEATAGQTGTQLYVYDDAFRTLGKDWWPPVLILAVLGGLTWLVTAKTVTGRHLYAMGGNEEAARLCGVRTERLKWLAYVFGAVTASIAGVLLFAEVAAADPSSMGLGYELNAIAAAVVGGCALTGGAGTVPGILLGALFLRTVVDAVAKLVKSGADDFEGLIVGGLVVAAVSLNELRGGGPRRRFFDGPLGLAAVPTLAVFAALTAAVLSADHAPRNAALAGLAAAAVLGAKKWGEARAGR